MRLFLALLLATGLWAQSPLDFDPRDLPRAEAGSWGDLGDEAQTQERFARIAPQVRRAFEEAQVALRRRDLPAVLGRLRFVLEREPDLPPAAKLMGSILFQLQRYDDAADCFERFLTHAPEQVWSTRHLGHCYYSMGDYERARDHYNRVLDSMPAEMDPAYRVEALRGRALSRMRVGEVEGALEDLRRVAELDPEHANAWAWIGQIHYEEGDLAEAEKALLEAQRIDAFDPRPWFLLSKVYYEQGHPDRAEQAQARWAELDQVAQELRSVEADLELNPHAFELVYRKIELHTAMGNIRGVRASVGELLARRPQDVPEVELRTYALRVLLKLGDDEGAAQAAADLESACSDEPETWKALQQYFASTGNSLRQVEAGEKYLRLRHR